MSTRCMVVFGHDDGEFVPVAMVYRHNDGYDTAMREDFARFFAAVEADTDDTRFGDPEYLAAKFVVWQSQMTRQATQVIESAMATRGFPVSRGRKDGLLNFLSVGVSLEAHGDIEYAYFVACGTRGTPSPLGRPRVFYQETPDAPAIDAKAWKPLRGGTRKSAKT